MGLAGYVYLRGINTCQLFLLLSLSGLLFLVLISRQLVVRTWAGLVARGSVQGGEAMGREGYGEVTCVLEESYGEEGHGKAVGSCGAEAMGRGVYGTGSIILQGVCPFRHQSASSQLFTPVRLRLVSVG